MLDTRKKILEKLKRKVEAGAHAFWTQPVFKIEALDLMPPASMPHLAEDVIEPIV